MDQDVKAMIGSRSAQQEMVGHQGYHTTCAPSRVARHYIGDDSDDDTEESNSETEESSNETEESSFADWVESICQRMNISDNSLMQGMLKVDVPGVLG